MTIGLIGHTVVDTVVGAGGQESRRLGGTPFYARRSLEAAGAPCVVVTRGADPGDAVVIPGGPAYDSRLDHRDGATRQVLAAIGLPFGVAETRAVVLPAVRGCGWLHLGTQSAGDFPPETIAVLRAAGHLLCLDGQGIARGPDPGPVRLRPFPAAAVAGVHILKLNREEARAAGGPRHEGLRALGIPEVVVTMAGAGVLVDTAEGIVELPGTGAGDYPDPTGAGDTFTAAYVLHRTRGADPPAAARAAQEHTDRLFLPERPRPAPGR